MHTSYAITALALVALAAITGKAFCADSEFSNTQEGVRMKVLGYDQDTPKLRIENNGNLTLAIQNNVSLTVSLWNGDTKVNHMLGGLNGNGLRQTNIDQIAILGPGASLEVPLRQIYFDVGESGYGHRDNWNEGLRMIAPGNYLARFTTNGMHISVLNVNFSPFKQNFNIPDLQITVKGSVP